MAVGEGKFLLYSFIDPPLPVGEYRFRTDLLLSGTDSTGTRDADDMPVQQLDTHVRIRTPRYQLPPDQVLSTFPPANTEGAYGSRLPQVVIKRRTLPWERDLAGQPSTTPWLALVLIAEGEAELMMNQPVDHCVTPGVTLPGIADSQLGNYLKLRKSVINRVFPTCKDVPLLAHAREVDIHDTELMMGDDDGFLAVVVSNRLPVPGRDANGDEVPVKYLACLINLEGQFDALLPEAPPVSSRFSDLTLFAELPVDVAQWDHIASGHTASTLNPEIGIGLAGPFGPIGPGGTPADAAAADGNDPAPLADGFAAGPTSRLMPNAPAGAAAYIPTASWSIEDAIDQPVSVYHEMARDFAVAGSLHQFDNLDFITRDPVYRFPVLLHWSFTSTGNKTFRRLMEDLDSGLLSSLPDQPRLATPGRPPIEVVETGHVGLPHRTRRGDAVRSWYRGPLVPHPTKDPASGRLSLAHAADQLRIVVPDGREDLSLAAAFEIGRLIALSRPGIVGSMMRWRQAGYLSARRLSILEINADLLDELFGEVSPIVDNPLPHVVIGREFVKRVTLAPGELLGPPRAMFDPGRPLELDEPALDLLTTGFAIDTGILSGTPTEMLDSLRSFQVPVARQLGDVGEIGGLVEGGLLGGLQKQAIAATLHAGLDLELQGLVSDTLAGQFDLNPVVGPAMPRTTPIAPNRGRGRAPRRDALDRLNADITFDAHTDRGDVS